jgi:hypothetical protein
MDSINDYEKGETSNLQENVTSPEVKTALFRKGSDD